MLSVKYERNYHKSALLSVEIKIISLVLIVSFLSSYKILAYKKVMLKAID